MDSFGPSLPWANSANDFDHNSTRQSGSFPTRPNTQSAPHNQTAQTIIQVCADVKPRLTKEQHDILERHFQQQPKPTTSTKKGFADALGVPLDKINNWFQNRRAKVKQDLKKQLNAYQMYQATLAQHQQHQQQYLPPAQPLPSSIPQEFFGPQPVVPSSDIPADSGTSSASSDNGSTHTNNFPNRQEYNVVPTIIETSQPGSQEGIVSSLNAAGYDVPRSVMSSAPGAENALSFGPPHFPHDFEGPSFLSGDFNDFETSFGDIGGDLPDSLAYPPFIQQSAPPVQAIDTNIPTSSSMPSLSESQSLGSLSSSESPNHMPSLTSAYTHRDWSEDRKLSIPVDSPRDPLDNSIPVSQQVQAPSAQAPTMWPSAQLMEHQLAAQPGFYQQHNPSAPVLSAQEQQELAQTDLPSEAFGRRNSSTTALAESMSTVDITAHSATELGNMQSVQPGGLAARRQKPRPANLGAAALRSASYSAGMPASPGANQNLTAPDQALRRIRSTGVANGGRITKATPTGQRSPLNFSFAEAAASPKFARHTSNYSVSTISSGPLSATTGSLAPPTPLTPNEFSRFPSWQSHGVLKTYPINCNTNGMPGSYSGEPLLSPLYVNVSSPPDTPLDADQLAQFRAHFQARNQALYRDTPPQSAPATQQNFAPTALIPQSQPMAHSFSGDKSSHIRRPSLPDASLGPDAQMHWPAVPMFNPAGDLQMSNPMQFNTHVQQFTPPPQMSHGSHNFSSAMQDPLVKPEFSVHHYSPPQGASSSPSPPKSDSMPKVYHFANQGPRDFEAPPTTKS